MKRLVHGTRRLPRPRGSLYLLAAILISIALFAACQKVYVNNDMTVYSGKVTFEGKPVAGAEVYLQITTGSTEKLHGSHRTTKRVARTGRDGSFVFSFKPQPRNTSKSIFVRAKGCSIGGTNIITNMDPTAIDIELFRPTAIAGVVRSKDGAPLADVELGFGGYRYLDSMLGGKQFSSIVTEMMVRTDAKGQYRLEGVPAGSNITLVVGKPGYVEMRSGARAGKTDHDITLAQGGSITGRALDAATGAPVESLSVEARVNLQNASGYGSAHTGKDGRYVIEDIPPGAYTVKCSPGAKQNDGLCVRPKESVRVETGIATTLDFSLEKGIMLSGIITDEITGKPLADCWILASSPLKEGDFPQYTREDGKTFTSPPSEVFTTGGTNSGPDGRFTVTTLPGHVFLRVTDPGVILRGSGRVINADTIVEAGKKPADMAIAIPLEVVFPGRVFMPDGSPAAGADVESTIPRIVTDRDGRFTYVIPIFGREATFKADMPKLGLEGSMTLTPVAGDSILIRLHPYLYTSLSGKVVDTAGKPIAGGVIELYLNSGMIALVDSQAAVSGADGSFMVDSLRVGKRYSLGILGRMVESPPFIAADPQTPVTLVMPIADRWLAGTVTDTKGLPVSRASVIMYSENSGRREVLTDDRGRFRLDRLVSDREILNIIDSAKENVTAQEVATNTDRVYVLLPHRRFLGGQVLDTDGKPVPGARIVADQIEYLLRRKLQAVANAQGRFYLNNIAGEEVTVTVTCDGYTPLTTTVATNRDDAVFTLGK